ncbi:PadR family transcriptional regulator [Paenibacillus sp. 1A_MP2]|uniref:PadR family transcriptional regulator n=1 Tax=Paenibacillus sp. 1A_MP2 TaxID=3457495 RepID=UPI003FCD87AC
MDEQAINSDLIRGNIDPIILSVLILKDNYGYSIIKEIYRKSGERFELKEPTLYSSLKRLEKSGYVESYWGKRPREDDANITGLQRRARKLIHSKFKLGTQPKH